MQYNMLIAPSFEIFDGEDEGSGSRCSIFDFDNADLAGIQDLEFAPSIATCPDKHSLASRVVEAWKEFVTSSKLIASITICTHRHF